MGPVRTNRPGFYTDATLFHRGAKNGTDRCTSALVAMDPPVLFSASVLIGRRRRHTHVRGGQKGRGRGADGKMHH